MPHLRIILQRVFFRWGLVFQVAGARMPTRWAGGRPAHARRREPSVLNDDDLRHLRRCVELATEALADGDEPFGSVLVSGSGDVLAEDRNRVASGDQTRHPEFELARWSTSHVSPPPVRTLSIREVVPGVAVDGPAPELAEQVHELHRRFHKGDRPEQCPDE